jgi:hypothetical protein
MKSNLARMIEEAVNDCIAYGSGRSRDIPTDIDVEATWAENEKDVEVTIFEHCAIRLTYIEHVEI